MEWILLAAISLTVFGAVGAIGAAVMQTGSTQSEGMLRQREELTRVALQELFISGVTPRQVEILTIATAVIVGFALQLLVGNVVLAIAIAVGIFFLPVPYFNYLRMQRLKKFDEQLPDALTFLSNSTKSGMSLAQAIEEVTRQAPAPASEEFGLILQNHKLGTDMGAAIEMARQRLQSRNFSLVATALLVSREKGGNLPEALDTMANSLKEIWRTEQKLITASSEGRKAVWVISGMPIFIFLMIVAFQPQIAETLTTDFVGMIILFVAVVVYLSGIFWLMRVLSIDV